MDEWSKIEKFIIDSDIADIAINNLTVDLLKQTYKWQNTTLKCNKPSFLRKI